MPWATINEVSTYTGAAVSQDELTQAQAIIDLFSGVTEDATVVGTKNARLLKMAVAYQSAWQASHSDVFTNVDITSMQQDGVNFTNAHDNAGILAPLAKRALDRLSWRRLPRSIRVMKDSDHMGSIGVDYVNSDSSAIDDNRHWSTM